MNKHFSYVPQKYTTHEQWGIHIFLFLFVMGLCYLGLSMTQDAALHTMAWLAIISNIGVMLLAIYESKTKTRQV
jgi:hypothetical protein